MEAMPMREAVAGGRRNRREQMVAGRRGMVKGSAEGRAEAGSSRENGNLFNAMKVCRGNYLQCTGGEIGQWHAGS
jgi:hypothetical protein